jgi:MFS family permease
MLGNGLQGSLLGVRAGGAGFSDTATGIVMAGYFAGFLAGSLIAPVAVRGVGHIRVFAALAAIASIAILVHGLFVTPVVWTGMRLITGFAYAGLYVVAESWLNDRSSNADRGGLLAIYMIVGYLGMGGGQVLLNAAPTDDIDLFILVSVLVSVAVVPLLLSAGTDAPSARAPRALGLVELYQQSPLGVTGTLVSGFAKGAVFGMGAVYARAIGLPVPEVALFMGTLIVGGAIFQWPLGKLSDRFDRRLVICGVALATAAAAAGTHAAAAELWTLIALASVFGGLMLALYPLCLAYINDHVAPDQMVAASRGAVLCTGAGAVMGPLLVGPLMDVIGPVAFFGILALVHGAMGGFGLWRMHRRAAPRERTPYVALSASGSPVSTAAAATFAAVRRGVAQVVQPLTPAPRPEAEPRDDAGQIV